MASKSSAQIRAGQEYTFVRLRGVIDEDNQLDALREQITHEVVILDLAEVDRINSYGVRDWVNWLGALQDNGHRLVLVRCSTAMVAQANMVTNFCASALIVSFYAPYYNPATDQSVDKLLSVEEFLGKGDIVAPAFYDEDTGEALEFDDFEESYFSFLKAMEGRTLDDHLRALLADASPEMMDKLHALGQGSLSNLSGPVHTANLRRHDTPTASEGFPRLLSSARDVERAEAKVRIPTDASASGQRQIQTVQSQAVPPRHDTRAPTMPHDAAPRPALAPQPVSPTPSPAPSTLSWLPYALIAVALVVVAVLLYLVLTIQ